MYDYLIRKRNAPERLMNSLPLFSEQKPELNDPDAGIERITRKFEVMGPGLTVFALRLLSEIAHEKEISQAAFFRVEEAEGRQRLKFLAGYACPGSSESRDILDLGESLPGKVAREGKAITLTSIPEGYMTIESGLGKSSPVSLIIFPVRTGTTITAVIELASFKRFTRQDEEFFEKLSPFIGNKIAGQTDKTLN